MPTDKPRYTITLDAELLKKIDDKQRFKTDARDTKLPICQLTRKAKNSYQRQNHLRIDTTRQLNQIGSNSRIYGFHRKRRKQITEKAIQYRSFIIKRKENIAENRFGCILF